MSQSASPQKIGSVLQGLASMTFVGWLLGNVCICLALAVAWRFGYIDVNAWRYRLADFFSKQEFINPQELVPESMKFHSLRRLDLDGDGEMERVMFYRYDVVGGRAPFGAIVLDLNNCRPRGIDTYELLAIDQDYLSEWNIDIELRDIPSVGGQQEVLVWGKTADNIRTELAVFQWYDYSQPCSPPAPGQRGYWNLGFFRGTGGIQIEGPRVRVKDRAFERSQLAVTRVYEPVNGSYRQSPAGPMLDPVSKAVEFTFTPPTPVPQTYYPEKSVLAFYLAIGLNTAEAREYLSPEAAARYLDGDYGRDVAEPGQLTSMAEVKEIAYYPDAEKERRHERIAVEVLVVNRRPDGTITGPFRYRVWVQGVPRKGAFPYDCEWRIVEFEPL